MCVIGSIPDREPRTGLRGRCRGLGGACTAAPFPVPAAPNGQESLTVGRAMVGDAAHMLSRSAIERGGHHLIQVMLRERSGF
jgi:hypothetical protein